jgi:hypothetical protein
MLHQLRKGNTRGAFSLDKDLLSVFAARMFLSKHSLRNLKLTQVREYMASSSCREHEIMNTMLLDDFLTEHKKVEQQEATITELKKELRADAARQREADRGAYCGLTESERAA